MREARPTVPITLVTPITSPGRERMPDAAGMTLEAIRSALFEVFAVLREDDDRLTLVDGHEILAPHEAVLLPDGLHPNPEGYRLMGERLAARLVGPAGS